MRAHRGLGLQVLLGVSLTSRSSREVALNVPASLAEAGMGLPGNGYGEGLYASGSGLQVLGTTGGAEDGAAQFPP